MLEFSIRRHAARDTTFEFYALSGGDWTGQGPLRQYTGFSLLRWTIAERFRHVGKAIYLDADQICLADIGELWNADAPESSASVCVWCTRYEHRPRRKFFSLWRKRIVLPESSVMMIDCAKAKGRMRTFAEIERRLAESPTRSAYDDIMHMLYLDPQPGVVAPWWNVMDGRGGEPGRFFDPRVKLIHYTRVASQPWYDPDHPARSIWEEHLAGAIDAGQVHRDEIESACQAFSTAHGKRPNGMHPYWMRRFVEA